MIFYFAAIFIYFKLWDLRKKAIVNEFFGHEQTVSCAKLIQSDKYIASCSHDSTVRLWDVASLSKKKKKKIKSY